MIFIVYRRGFIPSAYTKGHNRTLRSCLKQGLRALGHQIRVIESPKFDEYRRVTAISMPLLWIMQLNNSAPIFLSLLTCT